MTAVMDAVESAVEDVARLYPLNAVPNGPQYPYGTYSATLGRGDTYLLDSTEGVRHGRIVVQTFGKTAAAALAKAESARSALVGAALTITGYRATPVRAELDPQVVRDPDDKGVVGVTATYTFTATKET